MNDTTFIQQGNGGELIPITQTDDGRRAVSGRALHEFLQVQTQYKDWFKRMVRYGFTEGQDYVLKNEQSSSPAGMPSRPRLNHILTLDMAKEISMVQRTTRGREARRYFIEVEKRAHDIAAPTGPELLARAVLEANSTIAAIEAENRALAPRADVADKFLTAEGDYEVADAAKILTNGGVQTGRDRLFAALAHKGWIYRHKGDGKWRVKQSAIDSGHMAVLPKQHYHPKTGVLVIDPPQPRVTFKGIARIGADYGAVIDPTATAAIEQSGGNAA